MDEVRKELIEVRVEAEEERKQASIAARDAADKVEVRSAFSSAGSGAAAAAAVDGNPVPDRVGLCNAIRLSSFVRCLV